MAISTNRQSDWIDKINRKVMPFVEYEGYENRYPANDIREISENRVAELRKVSQILFEAFSKVVIACQHFDDNILKEMEIPEKIIPYLRYGNVMKIPTWLSRFDFVVDRFGRYKMVEINADTPCAVVESFYANELACKHFRYRNPNEGAYEELKQWLSDIYWKSSPAMNLGTGEFSSDKPFIFSCFEDYVEDYGTTLFLMNAMKEGVGSFIPDDAIRFESFYTLGVDEAGQIIISDGRAAKGIYRLHPMEILIEEMTEDGQSLGTDFMDGYRQGRFTMFNPPEAIIMQSKGFQALVWELAEKNSEVFSLTELRTIKKYMLPSFFEQDIECGIWQNPGEKWIKKPLWGREGLGITVVDEKGNVQISRDDIEAEDVVRGESNSVLWQKYVDQSEIKAYTDEGFLSGYQTVSCFMLGNKPSAIYSRFSPYEIAATEAYWLPVGIH